MQTYSEDRQTQTVGGSFSLLFMGVLGVCSLALTHQILTGWIALGDRANISRHNISLLEWGLAMGAFLLGSAALRTAWGLFKGEHAGAAWAQWVSMIMVVLGITLAVNEALAATSSGSAVFNSSRAVLAGGVILLSLGVYLYTTRHTAMPPLRQISIQIAETPYAGPMISFFFVFLFFGMASELFLSPTGIGSVLTNNATKGIIAIGVTILMISNEFDLSVGSVLGVTAMAFMIFMTEGLQGAGPFSFGPQSVYVSALLALICACVMGLINGLVRVTTRIHSFIVTLATLFMYRAISLVVIGGGRILRYRDYYDEFPQMYINRWIIIFLAAAGIASLVYSGYHFLPLYWRNFTRKWAIQHNNGDFGTLTALISGVWLLAAGVAIVVVLIWLALVMAYHIDHLDSLLQVGFFDVANGRWAFTLSEVTGGNISILIPRDANYRNAIVWWGVLVVFFQIILMQTRYGNAVFATGGNEGAARAQGVNPNRVKVQNFVLCSFLVGISAILETARNPGVDPLKGDTWELEVIAMSVIGGALLTGGYGSIIGAMFGVLIFGMLQTGLVLIGMDPRMFAGVAGFIMLVAVVFYTSLKRART